MRSYHVFLSRYRAGSRIKAPRHFLLYYLTGKDTAVVSRILHDSCDLARHVPDEHLGQAKSGE